MFNCPNRRQLMGWQSESDIILYHPILVIFMCPLNNQLLNGSGAGLRSLQSQPSMIKTRLAVWACRHRLPRERGFLPGLFDFNLMSELKQSLLFCLAGSLIYVGMLTQPAWSLLTRQICGHRTGTYRTWSSFQLFVLPNCVIFYDFGRIKFNCKF